jgi:hypothetical protein
MYYVYAIFLGLVISEYFNTRGVKRPWHKPRHLEGQASWTATNLALSGSVAVWTETPDGYCEDVELPMETVGTCTSWISVGPGKAYELKSPWAGQACDARVSVGPDHIATILYSLYSDMGHKYAIAWATPSGMKHLLLGGPSFAVLDHPGDYIRLVRGVPKVGTTAEIFVMKAPEGPMSTFFETVPAPKARPDDFVLVANFVRHENEFIGLAKRRKRTTWAFFQNQGLPMFDFVGIVLNADAKCTYISKPFKIVAHQMPQADFVMPMSLDLQSATHLRIGLGISDCYAGFARMPIDYFVDFVKKPEASGSRMLLRAYPLDATIVM